MYNQICAIIYEIKDSFPKNYESRISDEALDEKLIRNEEQTTEKRYLNYTYKL